MTSVPPSSEAAVTHSNEHPHEPEIAPVYDAEGRCLICVASVRDERIAALEERLATSLVNESSYFDQLREAERALREIENKPYRAEEVTRGYLAALPPESAEG